MKKGLLGTRKSINPGQTAETLPLAFGRFSECLFGYSTLLQYVRNEMVVQRTYKAHENSS